MFWFPMWRRKPKSIGSGIGLHSGARFICNVPPEAGQVWSFAEHEGCIVLNCEFGVFLVGPSGGISRILTRAPIQPPRAEEPAAPVSPAIGDAVGAALKAALSSGAAASMPGIAGIPPEVIALAASVGHTHRRSPDPSDGPAPGSQPPT